MCEEQPSISSGKQPQHLTVSLSSRIATGGSLLRHLKGVLVEPTLQGGAVKGDLAPGELWVTTKPTKSSQIPRKRSSRGSSLSQRVCVLFIQAMKGYLFQPAREILGYVMLGMKRMRHFFFFSFSWRKELCNSPETTSSFHNHSCPQKLLYHKINSQSPGLRG